VINKGPNHTYHKSTSIWTSKCPISRDIRRPAQSNFEIKSKPQVRLILGVVCNDRPYVAPVQKNKRQKVFVSTLRYYLSIETDISFENSETDSNITSDIKFEKKLKYINSVEEI